MLDAQRCMPSSVEVAAVSIGRNVLVLDARARKEVQAPHEDG